MMKTIAAAVLGGAFALTAVAEANAWSRDRSVSGTNGTASMHASGGCSGGVCSRDVTRTGPNGNTVTRQGSVNW